jgi:hypothetical protein
MHGEPNAALVRVTSRRLDAVVYAIAATLALMLATLAPASESAEGAMALLTIQPLDGEPLSFTAAEWAQLPRASVRTTEHGGGQASFEGVAVSELLQRAGAPLGQALRARNQRLYLVARAADGYEVVFALAEFDPAFSDRVILIADRRNGEPLGPAEGPLRLVVPGDKAQARWVRMLQAVRIQTAP